MISISVYIFGDVLLNAQHVSSLSGAQEYFSSFGLFKLVVQNLVFLIGYKMKKKSFYVKLKRPGFEPRSMDYGANSLPLSYLTR